MLESIKARRSIRKYKVDEQVTRKQIDTLLEAAMFAPSAGNFRPWEFIVVTKRETLDSIAKSFTYTKMCETASAAIIVIAIPEKSKNYFPQDCSAATQNILLAAHTIGLGTCWCGIYPNQGRMKVLENILLLEPKKVPFCIIAVGVPDEAPDARGFFEKEKVTYM